MKYKWKGQYYQNLEKVKGCLKLISLVNTKIVSKTEKYLRNTEENYGE